VKERVWLLCCSKIGTDIEGAGRAALLLKVWDGHCRGGCGCSAAQRLGLTLKGRVWLLCCSRCGTGTEGAGVAALLLKVWDWH
jgi:hypothetical protein